METDLQLLSRYHRQGDAGAFQSLVQSHAGMVHAVAARVTRDAMLAQDVAQETFLALARSSGAAIQSVGAWLHHVAWQKARDCVRGESHRRHYENAAAEQLRQSSDEATWAELEPMLDEAMDELPQETKAVLIARFFRGRTQQQIAAELRVSQSTVSRAIDNGIAELRSKLRSRGVICGVGLAALLSTHGVQAAPAALITNLGKLALTGVGAATLQVSLTQTILSAVMTPAGKLITAAAVAALAATALGTHLASDKSPTQTTGATVSTAVDARSTQTTAASAIRTHSAQGSAASTPTGTSPASFAAPAVATTKKPSSALLMKLSALKKSSDFEAFVLRLFATKDPARIAAELREQMGVDLPPQLIAGRLSHPNVLQVAIVNQLGADHPAEALAWLAMFEGTSNLITMNVYRQIFDKHPEITAESMATTLLDGINREQVLGLLRAQRDPIAEATRVMTTTQDAKARQNSLWQLANLWPKDKAAEGLGWAMAHLQGQDINAFVPELVEQFSRTDPDATMAFLATMQDKELLARSVTETFSHMVGTHHRPGDLVPLINKLDGRERDYAITGLATAWVRADQESLVQWLNTIESPADFDVALPATLPQLSPENYQRAISNLMTQLDARLEAALIRTAMPNYPQTTATTMDIIKRLTALPQYRQIASGGSANQELLWQAVNQNAAGWVSKQGATPIEGARWIDTLPFRSAADKAIVAAKLYGQWKLSDPNAAAQWARTAGVVVR